MLLFAAMGAAPWTRRLAAAQAPSSPPGRCPRSAGDVSCVDVWPPPTSPPLSLLPGTDDTLASRCRRTCSSMRAGGVRGARRRRGQRRLDGGRIARPQLRHELAALAQRPRQQLGQVDAAPGDRRRKRAAPRRSSPRRSTARRPRRSRRAAGHAPPRSAGRRRASSARPARSTPARRRRRRRGGGTSRIATTSTTRSEKPPRFSLLDLGEQAIALLDQLAALRRPAPAPRARAAFVRCAMKSSAFPRTRRRRPGSCAPRACPRAPAAPG